MKRRKIINQDLELNQLDSDEEIFYSKENDTIILTRLPREKEKFEDFNNEKVLHIKINKKREWYIIREKIKRKEFIKDLIEMAKDTNKVKKELRKRL